MRFIRFGLSLLVTLAVVWAPVLPPGHLHRAGIEGRTKPLLHAHALTGADTGGGAVRAGVSFGVPHGNHGLAVFLNLDYGRLPRFVLQPATLVGTVAPPAPAFAVIHTAARDVAETINGPPRSVWLTRGPPPRS
jgi:hypothetical protein